ncbi:cell division protein FtsX [Acidiluteibacter ferrifornacis]|uniref:Cell division protein FtsX n=1 Tax=Acidiluteibacter ferrifornacis TaxID=2692424 RepID=A0A6N9NDG6_9FLAO|nr:permease-like cell division protein FtsX [Acidiluteibacter ferrifornacis]NBG64618.1 cell division protein FtsX [Acidiluteibacter ferrifornacis]
MSKEEKKVARKSIRTSYISTIISISLVLFMLGLLGLIILNAQKLSNHVKENIGFSIFLHENTTVEQAAKIQETLNKQAYVKRTKFINKEEAAKLLQQDLGEDFVQFLGYNPLLASIDVNMNAAYAHPDSIGWIEASLARNPQILEVSYQKDLISAVNSNVRKIGAILLGFSLLLLIVVIALINNTIRLAIYSKRFLIKTMQLVGATGGFIRRPFVWRGIVNGFVSALIAIALLSGVIYSVAQNMPDILDIADLELYGILGAGVIVLGVLISWISTSLAVRKFLRIQSTDLY